MNANSFESRRRWAGLGLLLSLSSCLAGCLSAPTDEAEHHVPVHRPVDFLAAVKRLDGLHAELLEGAPPRDAGRIEAFAEMSDVVRWLPELAGDSDLDRTSWDRVAATTRAFEADLTRVLGEPIERRPHEYAKTADLIDKHLRALRELLEVYRAQENHP